MRRFWHVACGLICFALYYLTKTDLIFWAYACAIIALLGFVVDFKRAKDEKLNQVFSKFFGPILRKSERLSFSGLPFYALGVSISLFIYEKDIAILSILFLIFADPIASIVGVYFGKDRLLPNKTLQGTIACFISCFLLAIIYSYFQAAHPYYIIIFSFLAAMAGAIAEMLGAFNIDDNLVIPVLSGGVMTLLNYSFSVF